MQSSRERVCKKCGTIFRFWSQSGHYYLNSGITYTNRNGQERDVVECPHCNTTLSVVNTIAVDEEIRQGEERSKRRGEFISPYLDIVQKLSYREDELREMLRQTLYSQDDERRKMLRTALGLLKISRLSVDTLVSYLRDHYDDMEKRS